jgi:hypothetical protein
VACLIGDPPGQRHAFRLLRYQGPEQRSPDNAEEQQNPTRWGYSWTQSVLTRVLPLSAGTETSHRAGRPTAVCAKNSYGFRYRTQVETSRRSPHGLRELLVRGMRVPCEAWTMPDTPAMKQARLCSPIGAEGRRRGLGGRLRSIPDRRPTPRLKTGRAQMVSSVPPAAGCTALTSVRSTILATTFSSTGSCARSSASRCCVTSTRAACHVDQCPDTRTHRERAVRR